MLVTVLSAIQLQGFLDRIEDTTTTLLASATTYATFIAALRAFTGGQFSLTSTGTVKAVTGNGHSVSFADSAAAGSTAADYAKAAAWLRRLYERSRLLLISGGTAAPTDAQILAEMRFRIGEGVTELGPSAFATLSNW